MNIDEIKKELIDIKDMADSNNDESAHIAEDELVKRFLQDLAKKDSDDGILAREIIKTYTINFGRWHA